MQSMMQLLRGTHVKGRFFPRGCRVRMIQTSGSCLVLSDPDAYTTPCAVPTKNLARLTLFRVGLVNHQVGLPDQQGRWGLDAEDIRWSIAQCPPDCEIFELREASS
jgi:hypothetical protein